MPEPYFRVQAALGGNTVELSEDPLRPGELLLTADAGTRVRVRLNESRAGFLADALSRWYADREADAVHAHQGDTIIQYRDGAGWTFSADPEV